jgi:multidrug efflux system membrane fusion protein
MKNEQLAIEAYSRDDQTKLASGKLVTIDNQIDPTTGTVRFKGEFDNRDLSLWPNQFINVRLMLTVRKNAIVIPLAAIQRGTQGTYVYTIKNGHANLQPVKVDMTQGNISLIASGVAEGDQVVVDGQDRLQSGATVEVQGTGGSGDRSNGTGPTPRRASGQNGRPNGAGKAEGDPGPGGVAAPQGLQRQQDAGKQN